MNVDPQILTRAINLVTGLNAAFLGGYGMRLNGIYIYINNGVCDIPGRSIKLRFFTLSGLFKTLSQERLINFDEESIKKIIVKYQKLID